MSAPESSAPAAEASGRSTPIPPPGSVPSARTAPTARERLAGARLYLCSDARRERGDLPEFLDEVLANGVDIVQLRDKGMEAAEELEHLVVFAEAARRHGALLAVNDRADVAHAAGADVLHLGQGDLPVPAARAILGPTPEDVLIGRSTHARAEVEAAFTDPGVDYFCTGPCWPTPTKPGRPAPGLDLVRHAAGRARELGSDRPFFAIGGVDEARLEEVWEAGARRVVVVRALTEAADPGAAAGRLRARLAEA
ncbi:thiamine phosphate synthase [Streptomyces sp. P38-E01]|uniref:Thiamine-phosphate synthase n=1 Tax=Streptomyces tardus TaxID=2780544 RepID=A0A949JGE1_9ACTN|nr:thiamine phosphate synthase [Streptomyces tardus]MBU7599537.1 thiamine phosphate synthase [Streptomyces tardus]